MSKEKMTMKALDAKIMKTISEIKNLKTRYAVLCKELTKLQREREKLEARLSMMPSKRVRNRSER